VSFVIDNTNVLHRQRIQYIAHARSNAFHISGYFFEPDVERAIAWNNQRHQSAVPIKALMGTLRRLEPPTISEGFDELFCVRVDGTGNFVVKPLMT
jgi:hypothetical protein